MRIWPRNLFSLTDLPPTVAWRMIDMVYGEPRALVIGCIPQTMCVLLTWLRSGSFWSLAWGAAGIAILVARVLDAKAYQRRTSMDSPVTWAWRFLIGAWMTALLWSVGSAVIFLNSDYYLWLMILIVQAAFVMTCAVRNANVPVIAFGQICLVLAPLLALSLAQDDWYARAIGGFVLLHLQVAVLITRALHSQNLRLVIADEEKSHLLEELSALNLELASLATTDALTGLANRRCFDLALAREWRRAGREEIPLGLLMVDVDHFKAFNDRFGHPAGDSCLALVAKAIEKAVQRPTNVTARYGGEEFAVLLPITELQGAVHVAENVRRAVAALMISHPASSSGIVTLSIGAAAIIPGSSDHMEAFVSQADASLYTAKNAGRNRVAGREDARDKFA